MCVCATVPVCAGAPNAVKELLTETHGIEPYEIGMSPVKIQTEMWVCDSDCGNGGGSGITLNNFIFA